jgi:hypothetical protein
MNDEGIGIGVWERESGDAIMCIGFFYCRRVVQTSCIHFLACQTLKSVHFRGVVMRLRCVKLFLSNRTTS